MARRQSGLSERHRKIMEFLTKFQTSNGYPPSIRQIGDSINVKSTSLVDYYLNQLQEMGYIERENHISRSIRVLQPLQPGFPGNNILLLQIPTIPDLHSEYSHNNPSRFRTPCN